MRCESCPVRAGTPNPCLGTVHPPACGYVRAGRRDWIAHLVTLAEGRPASDAGRVDPRLAMAADTCPHGAGPCGCGAAPRLCGHPDRPAEVWRPACLACVARSAWEAAVEAIG